MDDLELDRRIAARDGQTRLGHVVAAHDSNRTLAVASPDCLAQTLPVEEALGRRQKSHELVVVPFLKLRRVAKFVVDLAPQARGTGLRQIFPVMLKRCSLWK